tara:strand:+ start:316 stop:1062 length:747 start_codon:yes stop_codon:yes gene_type:complete
MKNLISIKNLSYKIKEHKILKNINLSVYKGDRIGIIGKSGAGKSCLLSIMNGSRRASSGQVLWHGKEIIQLTKLERLNIATLWQDLRLINDFTVKQNINCGALGRNNLWFAINNLMNNVENKSLSHIMDICSLDIKLKDNFVENLSGGQKQRVAIARTINQEANYLLIDEPFLNLDPPLVKKMLEVLIINHHKRGNNMTSITCLHQPKLLEYFTRIIGIKQGQISLDIKSKELKDSDIANVYGKDNWD